jgi:hypothetical protein
VAGIQMMQETGGAKLPKGQVRNNDICDELIMSNKDMRFNPVEREAKARAEEQAELMREAEAALA